MERMSSWSVKGRVPATAATGNQNNIFGDSSVFSDCHLEPPINGAAAKSPLPLLLDLPVNAKK